MGCEKWGPFDRTSSPSIEWSVWRGTWERKHPKIKNTNGIGFVFWNLNLLCWSRDPLTQTSLDFQMATKREREREREESRKALVLLCGWQVWDWHLWMSDVPSMNPSPDCLFPVSTGMLNTQPMFHAVQLQIQLPRAPWTDFFTLYGTHLKLQLSYHHFQFQWHEQVYVSIQVNLWYLYVTWRKKFFIYIRDS